MEAVVWQESGGYLTSLAVLITMSVALHGLVLEETVDV